jgi:hypothetical protein
MSESTNPPQAETASTSEADADHSGESTMPDEATTGRISDEQLPEDLQPGEDNPLAEPLDPEDEDTKSPEELGMDQTQSDLNPYQDVKEGDEDSGEPEDSGSS